MFYCGVFSAVRTAIIDFPWICFFGIPSGVADSDLKTKIRISDIKHGYMNNR